MFSREVSEMFILELSCLPLWCLLKMLLFAEVSVCINAKLRKKGSAEILWRLFTLPLPLSPSLFAFWLASQIYSQSDVIGLPAGLDVLPAFQRVYDHSQMCIQEHTVPKAEINAGLTAVQPSYTGERKKRKQTV